METFTTTTTSFTLGHEVVDISTMTRSVSEPQVIHCTPNLELNTDKTIVSESALQQIKEALEHIGHSDNIKLLEQAPVVVIESTSAYTLDSVMTTTTTIPYWIRMDKCSAGERETAKRFVKQEENRIVPNRYSLKQERRDCVVMNTCGIKREPKDSNTGSSIKHEPKFSNAIINIKQEPKHHNTVNMKQKLRNIKQEQNQYAMSTKTCKQDEANVQKKKRYRTRQSTCPVRSHSNATTPTQYDRNNTKRVKYV